MGERGPAPKGDGPKLSYRLGKPKMPRSLPAEAKKWYNWACRELDEAKVLQVVDGAAVGKYAYWRMLWEEVAGKLTAETVLGTNARGESVKSAELMALKDIDALLSAAEKKLGFSPEDRMRIRGGGEKKESKLAQLRARK